MTIQKISENIFHLEDLFVAFENGNNTDKRLLEENDIIMIYLVLYT